MVSYCFAEVAGYSKIGSYTGNGSSDGPLVHCGFEPRFVLIKAATASNIWIMRDSARDTVNVSGLTLQANAVDSELSSNNAMDITSSGFKLRSADSATNQSGQTFVYIAFAKNPFKFALAR
jgi:hypothetical protein